MKSLDVPLMEAAALLECDPRDVEWWSWPEVFGSSAGPSGGIGGQSLTQFQVFGFQGPERSIMCCAGIWRPWRKFPEQRFQR